MPELSSRGQGDSCCYETMFVSRRTRTGNVSGDVQRVVKLCAQLLLALGHRSTHRDDWTRQFVSGFAQLICSYYYLESISVKHNHT